jgi:hypothetical protein
MRKFVLFTAASALLALGLASPAKADTTLTWDPDGSGPLAPVQVALIDPAPGDGISLDLSANSPVVGSTHTFLFQANLSVATNGVTNVIDNCSFGDSCYTFTAVVDETLTSILGNTFNFSLSTAPNANNVFDIYAYTPGLPADSLSGTGFSTGTKILEGQFLNDGSFSGSFSVTQPVTTGPLDKFGTNNYPAITTATGNGSFSGNIGNFTDISSAYFPLGIPGNFFFQASSELNTPFTAVDPSACFFFFTSPTASQQCTTGVGQQGATLASVGTQNGVNGSNTMLQTDANISIVGPSVVPEPATLTLLGMGLLGSAAARRRQLKKKASK